MAKQSTDNGVKDSKGYSLRENTSTVVRTIVIPSFDAHRRVIKGLIQDVNFDFSNFPAKYMPLRS